MLREKWQALRADLDKSNGINEDLRAELYACKAELKDTQELAAALERNVAQATGTSEISDAELKDLHEKIAAITSEREFERYEHRSQVAELSLRASCLQDEVLKLSRSLEDQGVELAQVRDNFSNVSAQLDSKVEELNSKSAELQQSSAQLLVLSTALEDTKVELAESKAELDRNRAQVAQSAKDVEEAQAGAAEATRMLSSRTEELDRKSSLAWKQVRVSL